MEYHPPNPLVIKLRASGYSPPAPLVIKLGLNLDFTPARAMQATKILGDDQ